MSYPEERLIPVRSLGELKPGQTLVRKRVIGCLHTHVDMLVRQTRPCKICGAMSWAAISDDCIGQSDGCYCVVLGEGRLFRLDTREKAKERTRELERAR